MAEIIDLENEIIETKDNGTTKKCDRPIDKECTKSLCKVIESIAEEEIAIAHILNAEGEKIKKAINLSKKVDDLVDINSSVSDTLKEIIKLQMLLQYKLEETNKAIK